MPPLFFIPGANTMSHDLLVAHGLDKLLGPSYESQQTYRGPGGVAGMVVCSVEVPLDRMQFVADKQTWSSRFGFTSLVGTWNDAAPTSAELQRDALLSGEDIELLDGSHWHIPILRAFRAFDDLIDWEIKLPRVLAQSAETGKWIVSAVVPQYAKLWESATKIADDLFVQLRGNTSASVDPADLFDFAVAVLQVNYRIDATLLSHLRIVHPDLAVQIVRIALDWPSLERHLKNALGRLRSGGTNTESGATQPTEAETTPTDPPSQNCSAG